VSETLLKTVGNYGLISQNYRDQGYGNEANIKSKHSRLQKRIIKLIVIVFIVRCGRHSFNLVVSGSVESSAQLMTLFEKKIQHLYSPHFSSLQPNTGACSSKPEESKLGLHLQ